MLQHLKPTEADLEKLALAETDPHQQPCFAPLRWGFLGNLGVIILAGGFGFAHAVLAGIWRRLFFPSRDGLG